MPGLGFRAAGLWKGAGLEDEGDEGENKTVEAAMLWEGRRVDKV